jgi:mRNA interferase MazF
MLYNYGQLNTEIVIILLKILALCRNIAMNGSGIVPWSVLENIAASSKWLKRKTELIEEKDKLIQKKATNGTAFLVQAYRGGIFDAELGEGNIGGEKNKTRPVVVFSPDNLNRGHTVVVVPLSTKFKTNPNGLAKYKNHYLLRKSDYPFLDKDSAVKFEDIRSIDVVRLRKLRGNVKKVDMKRMQRAILFVCGY